MGEVLLWGAGAALSFLAVGAFWSWLADRVSDPPSKDPPYRWRD